MKKKPSTSRSDALKIARYLGCRGAHETDSGWMPCSDHATLMRISNRAEKSLEFLLPSGNRKPRRRKKRGSNWENIGRERGVMSIDTLSGGGLVSGKVDSPCWPGYRMVGMKPGRRGRMVPNCVPVSEGDAKSERVVRRSDPDVFASAESARVRARQLGCIGIRSYSAMGGGQAWMPCTNESDYRRRLGTSPQGRIDIARRQMSELRRNIQRLNKKTHRSTEIKRASAASTPAPAKDRIYGSTRNRQGSASSASSASSIDLGKQTITSLKASVKRHNDRMEELGKPPWSRTNLDQLKAVWRRGAGAFSVSHRPNMTRSQWAFARVRAFLWMLEKGRPKKLSYITDIDLLSDSHPFKKRRTQSKDALQTDDQFSIETKSKFRRASRLGPSLGKRRMTLPRKPPKTDRDGDGDGFKYNPATGRDDMPALASRSTSIAKRIATASGALTQKRRNRKFTDDELIEAINAGFSTREIQEMYGASPTAIRVRAQKLRAAGKLSTTTQKGNYRRKITDDQIIEAVDAGFSVVEMARLFGVTTATIIDRVKKLRASGKLSAAPKKSRPNRKFADDELIEALNSGFLITEIAQLFGVEDSAIYQRLRRLRKEGRIPPRAEMVGQRRLATLREFPRTGSGVPDDFKPIPKLPFNESEQRRILELVNLGATRREIANDLKSNISLIDAALQALRQRGYGLRSLTRGKYGTEIVDQDKVLELYRKKRSITQIADELNTNYTTVALAVSNLRKAGRIRNRGEKRTKKRTILDLPGATDPKDQVIDRSDYSEIRKRYNALRSSQGRMESLRAVARETGLTASRISQIVGLDETRDRGSRTKFTEEQVRNIKREYQELRNSDTPSVVRRFLASYYGVSPSTIQNILGEMGEAGPRGYELIRGQRNDALARTRELVADGFTDKEIAELLDVSEATVKIYRRDLGISSNVASDRRKQQVIDLHRAGASHAEIAKQTGLSRASVGTAISRLIKEGKVEKRQPVKRESPAPERTPRKPKLPEKQARLLEAVRAGKAMDQILSENPDMGRVYVRNNVRNLQRQGLIESGTPFNELTTEQEFVLNGYLDGLSYAQIAQDAGISVEAVGRIAANLRNNGRLNVDDKRIRRQASLQRRNSTVRSNGEKSASPMNRKKVGSKYQLEQETKSLGRMLNPVRRMRGAARRVRPSEYDGDGDGFITNPATGRDDLPAPRAARNADGNQPRSLLGEFTGPTGSKPPRFDQMFPSEGGGGKKPPRIPGRGTPRDPDRPEPFPQRFVDSSGFEWIRDNDAIKVGSRQWLPGERAKVLNIPPAELPISLRDFNGLPLSIQQDLVDEVADATQPDAPDYLKDRLAAYQEMTPKEFKQKLWSERLVEYNRTARGYKKNRKREDFSAVDSQMEQLELDMATERGDQGEIAKMVDAVLNSPSAGRELDMSNSMRTMMAAWRFARRQNLRNPNYHHEAAPRLSDDELFSIADAAIPIFAEKEMEAKLALDLARSDDFPLQGLARRMIQAAVNKEAPAMTSFDDFMTIMDIVATELGYPSLWEIDEDLASDALQEAIIDGSLREFLNDDAPMEDGNQGLWYFLGQLGVQPPAPDDVPLAPNDPDWRPYIEGLPLEED